MSRIQKSHVLSYVRTKTWQEYETVTIRDALKLESLKTATVVAGHAGLDRELQWAHVIDMPDPAPWVRPG